MRIFSLVRPFIIIIVLILSFIAGALFFITHNKCIDFSVLERYNAGSPSILLDDEGNEWARFQLDRRQPIALSQIPPHVVNAFIAAEDWNFFNHAGMSWKGIVRATLINLSRGRKAQGASTITQQLVKLLFFDAQKTFSRKAKELIYAIVVEQQFSKQQILETYLNHVCFGCGIYGIEAACQRFWGKHVADVSIDEAAILAAIMRSPRRYCPITHPDVAQQRRNIVLTSMHKLAMINKEEYEKAKNTPVVIKEASPGCAPHVKESLRIFLEDWVGKTTLYSGGLTIQTTINKKMQQEAEEQFKKQISALRLALVPTIDGALMSIAVKTGEIKALIGGFDFKTSQFNRALQAKRQMGSTFKPLVYATAVAHGATFADTEIDEPLTLTVGTDIWQPNNVFDTFEGRMSLAHALSRSNNIVAIKTLLRVGINPVISIAKKAHIEGPFNPYPSLALGCVDATVKEVVGMFNIFANDGLYVEPHMVLWVKDRWGKKIWRHTEIKPEKVMDARVVGQVASVLGLSLQRMRNMYGTDTWIDSAAISKTGTTNDSRTCWFVGSTPEITTAVYVGCDNNRSLGKNVYPLRTAFPIWLGLHAHVPCKNKQFVYDQSLREVTIDAMSGTPTMPGADDAIRILMPCS